MALMVSEPKLAAAPVDLRCVANLAVFAGPLDPVDVLEVVSVTSVEARNSLEVV